MNNLKQIQGSKKKGRRLAYLQREAKRKLERERLHTLNNPKKLEAFMIANGILK